MKNKTTPTPNQIQRRDFIKKSSIGAMAVVAGSSVLSGLSVFAHERQGLGVLKDGSITSAFMNIELADKAPGFASFRIDGLGLGKSGVNAMKPAPQSDKQYTVTSTNNDSTHITDYRITGQPVSLPPVWSIRVSDRQIQLISNYTDQYQPEPLVLNFSLNKCHTTLLGLFNPDGTIRLPALMHLPGQGSVQITAPNNKDAKLGYTTDKATSDQKITLLPANSNSPVTYVFNITAIYPNLAGISDSRFDSFKRNWLNVLQLNPKTRLLANNTASTSCAFCYYEYADIAAQSPKLVDGLYALDVVQQTIDGVLGGTHAYGFPAPGNFPVESSDTIPAVLIAAYLCVDEGGQDKWLHANYKAFKAWADKMLATDKNGNGLFEYAVSGNSGIWPDGFPKTRPSNWWDTIGFGHEDAYGNALAYRALNGMKQMADKMGQEEDAARYQQAADKLKANYLKTFYNPQTGVIGGWRSADGQLHDYYFMWVNGIAIHYGLVPKDKANKIMDILLAKMKEVGYTQFNMGLPGNLITVALKDYVHKDADGHHGGGVREDNADGFQNYENGGATGCFAYFTLAALYSLGRKTEADQILFAMLGEYEKGGFEGRGPSGKSNDWRRWDGTPMGYEGFLVDNYYTLLSVPLRQGS